MYMTSKGGFWIEGDLPFEVIDRIVNTSPAELLYWVNLVTVPPALGRPFGRIANGAVITKGSDPETWPAAYSGTGIKPEDVDRAAEALRHAIYTIPKNRAIKDLLRENGSDINGDWWICSSCNAMNRAGFTQCMFVNQGVRCATPFPAKTELHETKTEFIQMAGIIWNNSALAWKLADISGPVQLMYETFNRSYVFWNLLCF